MFNISFLTTRISERKAKVKSFFEKCSIFLCPLPEGALQNPTILQHCRPERQRRTFPPFSRLLAIKGPSVHGEDAVPSERQMTAVLGELRKGLLV